MSPLWQALLTALSEPAAMARFDAATWDLVQRQARPTGLLGRLGALADRAGVLDTVPPAVRRHMQAWRQVASQQIRTVAWELEQLERELAPVEGPVLLLKGAAYAAAGLAPADGRLFSDIDLLVPKTLLDATESALLLAGWITPRQSAYDDRYYRRWMHELPPMQHIRRKTSLDLHHNILPETAKLRVRVEPIVERAQALPAKPRFCIPCPADQVLHSATHLFHEGEWGHGLRDLSDLDLLLRSHGQDAGFWAELRERAALLGLGRPLSYALALCAELLRTPMPAHTWRDCPGRPGLPAASAMHWLFKQAMSSAHKPTRLSFAALAAAALYVRSHHLRMPLHLLLRHLATKAWLRLRAPRAPDMPAAEQP